MDKVQTIVMETPGIVHSTGAAGQSFALGASGSNFGTMFVLLDRFEARNTPETRSDGIIAILRQRFEKEIPDAVVVVFPPPPIRGVDRAGGFKFMVEDRGDNGYELLDEEARLLIDKGTRWSRTTPNSRGTWTT